MSTSAPGNVSRRYRLLELLGQGGMGRVYAALDRLTGRQVALKQVALPGPAIRVTPTGPLAHPLADTVATLRSPKSLRRAGSQPTRLGGQELRLRLAHEFRTLASMRHPHIVSVLDYGFDEEGRPFYTMELLRGAAPLLQRAGEWQLDTQVELVAQLLRALCYLHRRGVLHREQYAPSRNAVLSFQNCVSATEARWKQCAGFAELASVTASSQPQPQPYFNMIAGRRFGQLLDASSWSASSDFSFRSPVDFSRPTGSRVRSNWSSEQAVPRSRSSLTRTMQS